MVPRLALRLLCTWALTASLTSSALAQPSDAARAEARRHYELAKKLVREAAYAEAAEEFRRAYETLPHFEVLYNLALAYVELGRSLDALATFERYLAEGASNVAPARRSEVEQEILRLRAQVGELRLTVAPAEARVLIDGQPTAAETRSSPIRLGVGRHEVTAQAQGYVPIARSFELVANEPLDLSIALERAPPRKAPPVPGKLEVTCRVPGAGISVDGRNVAKTPLEEPLLLPAGYRVLAFARAGYANVQSPVRVTSGKVASIDCGLQELNPLPPGVAAQLSVRVNEPLAIVLLDGDLLAPNGQVPFGEHVIEVRRDGFQVWRRAITLTPMTLTTMDVRLVPTPEAEAERQRVKATRRSIGIGLASGGVALGLTSLALYIDNGNRHSEWTQTQQAIDAQWPEAQGTPAAAALAEAQAQNNELGESIVARDRAALILGISGGALVVVGGAFFLASDPFHGSSALRWRAGPKRASLEWTSSW